MNKTQRKEWEDMINESYSSLNNPEDAFMYDTDKLLIAVNTYILKLERELHQLKSGKRIAAILKPKDSE